MSPDQDILLPDENDRQKALINIFYTYYFLVDKVNIKFKQYDITRQQFNVLRILKEHQPNYASVNLIKSRMLDKMSDVSRIVERLRIKGLVLRQSAEKDRRSVEVIITPKGLRLLDIMNPEIINLGQLLTNLTAEETTILNKMLDKIRIEGDNGMILRTVEELTATRAFERTR
ncbi:MAG: MarR family transcriptional regulator [Marivirga sp.]|nr:MarR family transcriptional regulator [Marivirga sp.]